MMTEWFASPAIVGSSLCFPDRTQKKTPSTSVATRQMVHFLFDLEAPLATWAGCARPGCETLSSVSSRYGVICCLPGRHSNASVCAPLASETEIGAPHRTYRATIF